MKKNLVKQDLNFMEVPLWFQDERLAKASSEGFVWKDNDGFTYRTGYRPPVKTDLIFLVYLLAQSQKQDWTTDLTLSRYQIIKDCNLIKSKFWYDRLEESLTRWKMIGLEFKGCFYDGKEYLSMNFGIIDSWVLDKASSMLHIRLAPLYLTKIRESKFFRYLNFDELKALHSPLATRVYELIVKMFQGRSFWEIDCVKLARKIPMNEKYPANIIPKIKAAVNRINEKASLGLKLHIRPAGRGKAFLGFEKLPADTHVEIQPPVTAGLPEDDEFKKLVHLIPPPENTKKTILEAVARTFKKHGFQYAARNIRYTTKQAKRNYRAYLNRALKEDLGRGWAEDQEALEKLEESRATERRAAALKKQQELEALRRETEISQAALARFRALPPEQQDHITQAAINNLAEPLKTHVLEKKIGWERAMNFAIREIMLTTSENSDPATAANSPETTR